MSTYQHSSLWNGLVPCHSKGTVALIPTITALLWKRILTYSNLQLASFYKGVNCVKQIVRFSPLLYPTVGGFGKDSGGQALITDLCQAARSLGNCALASNGGGGKSRNLPTRVLFCSNGRRYVPVSSPQGAMTSTIAGTDPGSYRKTTHIADKKNSQGCHDATQNVLVLKSS